MIKLKELLTEKKTELKDYPKDIQKNTLRQLTLTYNSIIGCYKLVSGVNQRIPLTLTNE